jgi:hypothetical protein
MIEHENGFLRKNILVIGIRIQNSTNPSWTKKLLLLSFFRCLLKTLSYSYATNRTFFGGEHPPDGMPEKLHPSYPGFG